MMNLLDIRRICRPRPAGSKAHRGVRDILLNSLQQMDLKPFDGKGFLWPYHDDGGETLANLLAVLPGTDPSLPPMILGAHYDTVPGTPGADDNAAAIWVVLNAVHTIKPGTLKRSVIVGVFDAEEPPYFLGPLMGSTNFYQAQLKRPVHCAFIFDLVGHDVPVPGIEDLVFITGMESHRSFESVINNATPDSGIRVVTALNKYVGDMSDHHVFRVHGEPYLFFSCGHWQHYHMPTDTPEKLSIHKMEALAAYVQKLLIACDGAEFPKGSSDYDTTATDLRLMNANLGQILKRFGYGPLRSREDIDRSVRALMTQFGL
ncbi:M28 family peptidase [bacterium]|nr:MAG: M28 family peptidase [bacterium]